MGNAIGVHGMVWVGGWSRPEAERAVASTAEAGYDLIELPALDPASFDVDMTARLLEKHGLAAAASLGLDDHTDVSSTDDAVVRAGRRRLADALALVRDLGGDYLGGVVYSKLGRYDRPVSERGRANSIETIAALADEARPSGVTVGVEICNRYETNVLNTVEQALAFIDEADRPNLVAHLDTYHMNIEESSMREPVLAAHRAGRLGYIHVGESHRGRLGTGTIAWREFFAALAEVGYGGTITFESFSSEVVHPSLSSALAIWRDTWRDSMDLARDARGFLRAHLDS
ncbi:sugar phosphate isomerase/epimerase family protein [Qaidamihabitans albus]|uniref:sugar phosphate isomerase/epimerase family protein n=1 Tax=Qaidamihabitans albus TaxID=2795733 RepID=UPI0027DACF50|nr:sugar phosphate isomerase/epimerase family protein [Qaidamihabitans albus]